MPNTFFAPSSDKSVFKAQASPSGHAAASAAFSAGGSAASAVSRSHFQKPATSVCAAGWRSLLASAGCFANAYLGSALCTGMLNACAAGATQSQNAAQRNALAVDPGLPGGAVE